MVNQQEDMLTDLVRAMNDHDSALGTYFRTLPRYELKKIFKNESAEFFNAAIIQLAHLEYYELCSAFHELMQEQIRNDSTLMT